MKHLFFASCEPEPVILFNKFWCCPCIVLHLKRSYPEIYVFLLKWVVIVLMKHFLITLFYSKALFKRMSLLKLTIISPFMRSFSTFSSKSYCLNVM